MATQEMATILSAVAQQWLDRSEPRWEKLSTFAEASREADELFQMLGYARAVLLQIAEQGRVPFADPEPEDVCFDAEHPEKGAHAFEWWEQQGATPSRLNAFVRPEAMQRLASATLAE